MPSKVAMTDPGMPTKKQPSAIMRWLRRILFLLLGIVVLFVGFLALSIYIDLRIGKTAADHTNTTYVAADSTELMAYVAMPKGDGPHPAVMMFHEWWGINDDIVQLADALATQGYVVLAPDAYRGRTTRWIPSAVYMVTQTDGDQIANDMDTGFEWLQSHDMVDSKNIGSVGFCFGGRQSYQLSMRQQEALSAVVALYGTAYTRANQMSDLPANVPILSIFGEDDQQIAADDARTMDEVARGMGLDHSMTIYPGVGHAFVNADNYNEAGAAGDAWAELSDFFALHLGGSAESAAIRTRIQAKAPFTAEQSGLEQLVCMIAPH